MIEQYALQIFEECEAIVKGHFVCATDSMHASKYIAKDRVYPHTEKVSSLCLDIANNFYAQNVQVVVAPEKGGIVLSHSTARHLSIAYNQQVHALYAEKTNGLFILRRGYDTFVPDKRVLVVEDVLNSGDSAQQVVREVERLGGIVVGVGAWWNRGGVTASHLGVPRLTSLVNIQLPTWTEEECKISGPCSQHIPINLLLGHGREYLEQKGRL